MRKPAWPPPRPHSSQSRTDPAPDILAHLAADIEALTVNVLRGRASASHESPFRGRWSPAAPNQAQAWHSDAGDGIDIWCGIEGAAARALLEIVLGGPGAATPTSLERGIVRETIERVLSTTGRIWEERAAAIFPSNLGWICLVTIASTRGEPAEFSLFAAAAEEPPAPAVQHVDLRKVPVTLAAALTPADVRIDAIAAWERGSVVPLGIEPDSAVRLFAGGMPIARGQLGVVNGRRAVRILGAQPEIRD